MGFALGQAGDWLPGGVLLLGVEGPRPDACGPAKLQFARTEWLSAGGGVRVEEVAGLGHGGQRRIEIDGRRSLVMTASLSAIRLSQS